MADLVEPLQGETFLREQSFDAGFRQPQLAGDSSVGFTLGFKGLLQCLDEFAGLRHDSVLQKYPLIIPTAVKNATI
jgi:hypothetical protein